MFRQQKGKCPICSIRLHKPGNKEGKRAASVDHDHKSKKVRGLLCAHCNRVKVSKNTLEAATAILRYLSVDFKYPVSTV